ncbi:hypothetical protein Tco_1099486 [Tanacetum coccineum]
MAGPVGGNQVARRVIDDLIDFSGETSIPKYMAFFFNQQIADRRRFINRMREEVQPSRNLIAQLIAYIAELEAFEDPGEVFDTLMCLMDDRRAEETKLADLNELITQAEEEIEAKNTHVEMMENEINDG